GAGPGEAERRGRGDAIAGSATEPDAGARPRERRVARAHRKRVADGTRDAHGPEEQLGALARGGGGSRGGCRAAAGGGVRLVERDRRGETGELVCTESSH